MDVLVAAFGLMGITWGGLLVMRLWDRRYALFLRDSAEHDLTRMPKLSVIVPACNETETIEAALRSLLAQDYPELELVVVNDRSTDSTGEILDTIGAEGDPRLRVLHIDELPQGWLGKNHALARGAEMATGDLLLFTDADVHYAPGSLQACVKSLDHLGLDHLVLAPEVETVGFWEKLMVAYFMWIFALRFRPERAYRDPKRFVGIGAFNMISREVYEAIGGHASMPLQVADDMMLGKAVKTHKFQQAAVGSEGAVSVRWAIGFWGLITGLEKNAYAGMDYSPRLCVAASLALLGCGLAPLAGAVMGGWIAVWSLVSWLLMGVAGALSARVTQSPLWVGFGFPIASILMSYILVRSAWLAEKRQGILWRGTMYPLELLREQPPLGYKL